LEIDANFVLAHRVLGWAYEREHRYAESITELKQGVNLSPGQSEPLASLGYVYAMSGQKGAALQVLAELRRLTAHTHDTSAGMAIVYAGLGEKDRAFEWLEKAFQERSAALVLLRVHPFFEPLRSDPRFQNLVGRVGIP
jgi:tetratricopeptide (TPR) repeat protein